MKCFVLVLLVNFLLVDGWKLSNWENDEENLPLEMSEASKVCANSFFFALWKIDARKESLYLLG